MKLNRTIFLFLFLYSSSAISATFVENYTKVLNIINGKPVEVLATPHLCGDAAPKGNSFDEEIIWRVDGVGSCKKTYTPNIKGLFTPLSHGGEISQFFFETKVYKELLLTIREMSKQKPQLLKPLFKLDVQMTFWELVAVLEWRRDLKIDWQPNIDQRKMNALLTEANTILSKVLFTKEDFSELKAITKNSTYFEKFKDDLLRGCYLEVDEPGRIHESMSQARLYGRIFIGVSNKKSCIQIKKLASEGKRNVLAVLPENVDAFKTVLVLYYNILDENYNVTTTNLIHAWREVSYKGVIDQSENIVKKLNLLDFKVISRNKALNYSKQNLQYHNVPEDKYVRLALLDVNPVYGAKLGSKVTTNKGNCYTCHSSKVKTFDFRSSGISKKLTFSAPFENESKKYRNEPLYEKVKSSFYLWKNKYIK